MIGKQQGHVLYEIIILFLVVGLLFSILYPNSIWKKEGELEGICQARMDAIRKMEFLYLSETNTFSDSVAKLIEVIGTNENQLAILDTVIQWDALVSEDKLKSIVMSKDLPDALVREVEEKLVSGKPIGNLGKLDSIQYKLISILDNKIEESSVSKIDSSVSWYQLLGSNTLYSMVQSSELPNTRKSQLRRAILNESPLNKVRGYSVFQPSLIDTLKAMIPWAKRSDVWLPENKSDWDEVALKAWNSEMDALPQILKDTLWQENISKFWDKERDIVWRDDRSKLWKAEGEDWRYNNRETWRRILDQKWKTESKKTWMDEQMATLPDSVIATFKTQRDSLWRVKLNEVEKQMAWEEEQMAGLSDSALAVFETQKDSIWKGILEDIQEEQFNAWLGEHVDETEEVIQNLWETERMLTWEDQAFQDWLSEKNNNMDKTWESLKEELWKTEQIDLWRIEEMKLNKKRKCMRQLDLAVQMNMLMDDDEISTLISNLELPDNKSLWKMMNEPGVKGNAVVYYGIGSLFRDDLLKSLHSCPVSGTSHVIDLNIMTSLKKVMVKCPIVDTSKVAFTWQLERTAVVNDSTGEIIGSRIDTSKVVLKPTVIEKLFGGREIKNHGTINDEGKKSWEKR